MIFFKLSAELLEKIYNGSKPFHVLQFYHYPRITLPNFLSFVWQNGFILKVHKLLDDS